MELPLQLYVFLPYANILDYNQHKWICLQTNDEPVMVIFKEFC